MSETVRVNGLAALRGHLERGQRGIRKAISRAIWSTAKKAVKPIRKRVPKAFGELSESVQAYSRGANDNPVTSVDAPHAGAVEKGSPPHKPNFERLLAWVYLRGLQGLTKSGRMRTGKFPKSAGPTTPAQARRIGLMFQALGVGNRRSAKGQKRFEDAAVKIAQAISRGIEKHGTKPHWYVRESLQEIRAILNDEVRKELDRATDNTNPAVSVKDSWLT